MGKKPLLAFVAVLIVAAIPSWSFLTKKREVIASTPSAYTGLETPLPLKANGEDCVDEVVFDQYSAIARFGAVTKPGTKAPALEITAAGVAGSPYRSQVRVPGGWEGRRILNVPLTPAPTSEYGTLCIRNLSNQPLDLVGSSDGRAYSRAGVKIDGVVTQIELNLRLMERGEHSYISRLGQLTAHASALKPLGAWWFWVLAVVLLAAAPLTLLAAMRSALGADAALLRAPTAPWPSARTRERLSRIPGWAIVAAVAAFAAVYYAYWGWYTHVFQLDEDQYVYLSRWLRTDFPASLFDFATYQRGLQRLEVWLLAIPATLFDSPWSLVGGRVLNAIAFVSTAIPVYKIGRQLQLRPQWAALPAATSVVVPWAVVTTSFLTENVAYPACLWAIWAIWRASEDPRWRRDLLALVLIFVAGLARSGLVLLAPVLPIVAAGTAWRCGLSWRRHWLLWTVVALGVLVLVLDGVGAPGANGLGARVAGGYATRVEFDISDTLAKWGDYLSKVVVGTGFFPAAIGLPWAAIALVRSREPGRFAFALTVWVAGLAMLYSLNSAGPDERYILYLGPLVLLAATLALAFRELNPLAVAIGSVLCALLLATVTWNPNPGGYGFFVEPVDTFYSRVMGSKLSELLPGGANMWRVLTALGLGAVGLAIAALLRWAPGRLRGATGALIVAAVVASVVVQTNYTLTKYVNGPGGRNSAGIRERAFVDRLVPDGARVGEFAEGAAGQGLPYVPLWRELQFYNQRVDTVFSLGPVEPVVPPGDAYVPNVVYDGTTGRVSSPKPLPEYLVVPTVVGYARIRGDVVAAPSYLAVALVRLAQPPTLSWSADGFQPDGTTVQGGGRVRFYGTGLPPGSSQCAAISYGSLNGAAGSWTMSIGGKVISSGTIPPFMQREVKVPLRDLVERGHVDATIQVVGRVAGINVVAGC